MSTLAERKAAIDAQRDATLDAGVMWDGKIWHADSTFQAQLTAFIGAFTGGLLPAQATVTIRSMDNVNNVLTLDQLKALALTVMAFVQTTYAASWAAKDAL